MHYFFNDVMNIKNFNPDKNKIDEKSYKKIYNYHIGYVMSKDSKYVKVNAVSPLHLFFNKVNKYFEEINENNYFNARPN